MRRQNGDRFLALLVILTLTQFTHYYSIYSKYGFATYHKDMSGKYKIISEREKRGIVKEIESGARPKDISRKRQIPLSSIYSWINKYKNLTKRKESKNQITAMDYVELKRSRDIRTTICINI
jgi:hypothetical protein